MLRGYSSSCCCFWAGALGLVALGVCFTSVHKSAASHEGASNFVACTLHALPRTPAHTPSTSVFYSNEGFSAVTTDIVTVLRPV
jgi:hypothetical protein